MGRKKKFSDEQMIEITIEALKDMTNQNDWVGDFNVMMIYEWAKERYDNIEYTDCYKDCVKKVLEEYRKKIRDVTGIVFRKKSSSVESINPFNARVFVNKYKDDLGKLTEELVAWGNKFNLNANMLLKQSDEIIRLRKELKGKTQGNSYFEEENKRLQEQIVLINNKYEKEKEERERLWEFIERIQKAAELMVIKDCNMASVVEEEGEEIKTLAEKVSYLKEKNIEGKNEHTRKVLKLYRTGKEEEQ